ncbi:MAG: nuclear transport factor 2 family protein [Acidobacteria bacterium]|nr:nuclear transport factor 2 family protein [Acidobacteriota bacterium]
MGVVQRHDGKQHMLRVWVERPAGWRLFVHHEVQSLPAPPTTTPGTGKECINPCQTVPYTPASDNERGVIAAYQALETSAHHADVANWGNHIAEEFQLVSSNSDRALTKEERLEGLRKSSFGGVSPTELLSANLYDFDSTVVMRSQHQPAKGAPLQISRVWVNRDGVWSLTLSYQTAVQSTTTTR